MEWNKLDVRLDCKKGVCMDKQRPGRRLLKSCKSEMMVAWIKMVGDSTGWAYSSYFGCSRDRTWWWIIGGDKGKGMDQEYL